VVSRKSNISGSTPVSGIVSPVSPKPEFQLG
jgi:hypothetical protein